MTSERFDILPATEPEREWAAHLLAESDPWLTLGATFEQCRTVCYDTSYLLFVAHVNQHPCGLLIVHPRGFASSPYIKSIAVDEGFRGRYVGSRLMGFAEAYASKEAKHLFLCVSSFNRKARQFYEKLGYQPVGELKDYIIEGDSEIILFKRLR